MAYLNKVMLIGNNGRRCRKRIRARHDKTWQSQGAKLKRLRYAQKWE